MRVFSNKTLSNSLLVWVPLAMVITAMSGLLYVVAQQQYRLGANDPQIQVARDAVTMANYGQPVDALVPTERVNIATSLAPFIMVYAADGKLVSGSGTLNNSSPTPPVGVLTTAKQRGEYRVTWQPQRGVRIAAVIVPLTSAQGGYILVGRNMREVEQRISDLIDIVSFGWVVTLAATLIACLGLAELKQRLVS